MTLTLTRQSAQKALFEIEPNNDFGVFPGTRYQGSKNKILDWIAYSTKDLKFETVLDSFGGTGSVGYMFKKQGKQVFYNDYLKMNYPAASGRGIQAVGSLSMGLRVPLEPLRKETSQQAVEEYSDLIISSDRL